MNETQQTESKPTNTRRYTPQTEQRRRPRTSGTTPQGTTPNHSRSNNRSRQQRHRRQAPTVHKGRPSTKKTVAIPESGDNIRIIPLGGVEEIGKNMTVIEYKNDIVVIDAGFEFTDQDTPGVDYILPNTKYLEERKDRIRGIVITHGHLDHIGGIPYLVEKLGNPPIYTREFGALVIKKRQEEFPHLPELNLRISEKNDSAVRLGEHLQVRFFGLTHSIPDSTGVIIETPHGDIVATGDVRVDNVDGEPTDKEKEQYAIFKDRNILLLAMDSTGIERPGWSMPEKTVIDTIDGIVKNTQGRVIIATFASQVERIIAFINTAKKYQRKVVVEGRSMKNNVAIVKHLKLVETDHVIPIEEMEKHPPHKIMVLATGAQGEEFAALMRMSNKTHKNIRLTSTDTVILSSSVIPGNEKAITKLKDNLYRHDARIITYLDSDVHASGHGKRDELRWIHSQIPYKFFMPVHGYHHMLKMHAEMATQLGVPQENIVVADNGSIIEIGNDGTTLNVLPEKVPSEDVVVEGSTIGDVQEVVIRDRKMLAEDGMFVIIASINLRTGKLKKSPDIISRGFVYLRESQELLQQARIIIKKTVESTTVGMNPINFDYVKQEVSEEVSKFLYRETHKHPIVIPVVLGV